jgi:DNA-binding NarL/FixJ family response regulator
MLDTKKPQIQTEKTTKILIVDDHPVVREGLRLLINQHLGREVCIEAENAKQAMRAIKSKPVDLAIVDISLDDTNGIRLTEIIKSQYPKIPVLILTMHEEPVYAKLALKAGAQGYLVKHEAADTIIKAILLLLDGEKYISEKLARQLSENEFLR